MRIWLLVLAAGCGRVNFEPSVGLGGASSDANDGGGSDGGASLCNQLSVLTCDGFEQPTLNARWTTNTRLGTVTVDTARAYRGQQSVHFHLDPATSADMLVFATIRSSEGLAGMITGIAHARAWAYFQTPLSGGAFNQVVNFVDLGGQGISMGSRDGFVGANDYTNVMQGVSTTVPFPLDRWVCLEFQIPNNTTGMTRVFVDGVEVVDVRLPKTTPQPPSDHVYFGLDFVFNSSPLPAMDAWFDEVIVDQAPTSCAQ